jgi:hypothetical protein
VTVMAIKPFWRYCVIPRNLAHREAAIPFYTSRGAFRLAEEMAGDGFTTLVFRKRRFRWRKIEGDPVLVAEGRSC